MLVFLVFRILIQNIYHLSASKERWHCTLITFVTIRASLEFWLFICEIYRVLVVLELTFSIVSVHGLASIVRLHWLLNCLIVLISRTNDKLHILVALLCWVNLIQVWKLIFRLVRAETLLLIELKPVNSNCMHHIIIFWTWFASFDNDWSVWSR